MKKKFKVGDVVYTNTHAVHQKNQKSLTGKRGVVVNNEDNQIGFSELESSSVITELEKEVKKYKKGFHILNCYFDSISDEEQPKVIKKLTKLGL